MTQKAPVFPAPSASLGAVGNDNRDHQIAPVAVAAVMAGGPDKLYRKTGFNRLHDRLIEPVQIVGETIRLRRDHVIEDMLRGLGAEVRDVTAPFMPEGGAYGGHSHGGGHGHSH